jgi:putative flavoprotein involved in K+ transport
MRFPARGDSFHGKGDVAEYLMEYAKRFHLPVRNGVRVDRLWKEDGRFVLTAGDQRFESENIVVAMANYQVPKIPAFARELGPEIVQLHSHQYRYPSHLQEGGVLVVGVGNSGARILAWRWHEVIRTGLPARSRVTSPSRSKASSRDFSWYG